ncbi:uncharacterized protein LOC124699981 [Lolium rigidum]|uniref:uncharacterized protein LOC124699981 n=1 Tax=Lolium rigidum TaxID=89674 RepID=UPI001F5DC101|nr:uncharacterized protein LOC124699981 [Lolium rigidum]
MAAGRRLSELLLDHQEPFLLEAAKTRRLRRGRTSAPGGGACCPVAACRRLLRLCSFKKRGVGIAGLRTALRRVLRWESLGAGGCFLPVGGGDGEFRRLRRRSAGDSGECDARAMEFGDDEHDRARWKADMEMEVDCSRQLSPVSVLELHSDVDESPVHSFWEDEKPSTSGSSPASEDFHGPTSPCFTYDIVDDKACAMDTTEEEDEEAVRNHRRSIEAQISAWERIAGDIAKIPGMVEQDLAQYMQQWRPEVREIGARIETLIFEDMRRETVCDMLASRCTLAPTSC